MSGRDPRARLAKLEALAEDPGAAVGERRAARMRVAELLADHPELDAERISERRATQEQERRRTDAEDLGARRRAAWSAHDIDPADYFDADEAREMVREALTHFGDRFGLQPDRLIRLFPWLDQADE